MSSSSCWSGGTGLEELEKLLILNSNRLRTFVNAHLEIVTFVEAKLGLRIRDSKPSETGARGHSDPKDVDATISPASGTGKGSSSPPGGRFQCGGAHVQRDCHVHVTPRKGNGQKGSRASHGPRVLTKVRAKKIRETDNPEENPPVPKVRKAPTREKPRTPVHLVLKNSQKQRQVHRHKESAQSYRADDSSADDSTFDDGWSYHEWNDDRNSVAWHECWEQTHDHSASSLSLGSFDLGAMSSPKRFEWVKMNLDTRAAVRRCQINCGPDGARDGRFYRTASGECILEGGAWQLQSDDENG